MPDLFPLSPAPVAAQAAAGWYELVKEGITGIAQVRQRRSAPAWRLELQWQGPGSLLSTIEAFLHGLEGAANTCYLYTPNPWQWWPRWTVGTGDGSDDEFTFGATAIQAGSYTVYVNSVAKTESTHYTLAATGDSYSRWKLAFVTPPPSTHAVEIAFRGKRALLGRVMAWQGPTPVRYDWMEITASFLGEYTDALNEQA